jgi:hypothetical protein
MSTIESRINIFISENELDENFSKLEKNFCNLKSFIEDGPYVKPQLKKYTKSEMVKWIGNKYGKDEIANIIWDSDSEIVCSCEKDEINLE